MQTRLFVLLLLLGANLHATAQSLEAFASGSAGANFVIFSATDTVINGKYIPAAASKLYRIDKATGKATAIVPNGGANYRHLDALGYNPIDNFLYALHDSTTANITPTGLELHPNTQLVRVDKNGREGILYAIAPPSAGVKPTLIIPTAADIDASGNYYFPAIVIKGITQTEPFVVDFDLYIGRPSG